MKKFFTLFIVLLFSTYFKSWSQYCPCTNAGGTCITNVTLNTLNNTTGGCSSGNYSQQLATTSLTQGASYTFSITCAANAITSVWIDFNHNFQYEATEWVQPSTSSTTGSAIIAVPVGAVPGVTGMRVRSRISNLQNGPTDACLAMGSGETEDYNVTIISTTPCSGTPVAGATTVNLANPCIGQQILLGISGNVSFGSMNYQWIKSNTGNSGTWVPIAGANSPFYVTSLTGNTCFRCIVTCTITNAFDTSSSLCINPGVYTPYSSCYCPCTNVGGACITNVNFNTLNNTTTGCTGTSNYNFYQTPVTNLVQGQSYMFTVTTNANAITSVWIDYNHDAVFSPSEWYQPAISATIGDTLIQIPLTSLPGQTRMRVRSRLPGNQNGSGAACIAMGSGETEDYIINILPAANHDPAITALNVPTGNCFTANQTFSATLTNYGQLPINMATNHIKIYLHKQGPNGNTTDSATVSTGILQAAAANSINVPITNVNMYAGGSYTVNTSLTIDTVGGVYNGLLQDDSLASPVTLQNYRPTPGPKYELCQYSGIPFGQGLTVSGCATPVFDSVLLTFSFPFAGNVPCLPSSNTVIGACLAGTTVLPTLPNPTFVSGKLTITNLAQANLVAIANNRFPLFKGTVPITNSSNIFYPSIAGSVGTTANFTWSNNIPSSVLSAIYDSLGAGGVLKLGHHHTSALNATFNGCTFNAGGNPTVATLKIVYSYVPNNYAWFETPGGGTSLSGTAPFNPFLTPNNIVNNSNNVGDYIFYVGCGPSPNCRAADTLRIHPKPVANNQTIGSCEDAVASNQGSFNLSSLSPLINNSPSNTIQYFFDPGNFLSIPNLTSNVSGSSTVYALVTDTITGCTAHAVVNEVVHTLPDIQLNSSTMVCAPASLNASSMIGPFSTIPPNSDTSYYADAACTIPHPNPFNITSAGSVYIVVKTNTVPVCSDTVQGLVNISAAGNTLVNQNVVNSSYSYSSPISVDPISTIYKLYTDGQNENVYTTDCKKVVSIHDLSNGISLGNTAVDVVIEDNIPIHNGQPYVKRYFKISPTVQDSANVCLYFLQTDFDEYSFAAPGWPDLGNPTLANLSISKVDNGDLNTPGHTHVVIPNSQITTAYDNVNQVWSACFKVDSFSWFYAHTTNPGNAALGVLWKKFTAMKEGDGSLLNWSTSMEHNNDYFQVERSRDGKYFDFISSPIPSKAIDGNSHNEIQYSFTDATPWEGHNYYRILQKDKDGKISHSVIRDVYFGTEALIHVFPNPAQDVLTISVQLNQARNLHVTLSDASGRIVREADLQGISGANEMRMNTGDLADGIYLIRISDGRSVQYSQSIRKQ